LKRFSSPFKIYMNPGNAENRKDNSMLSKIIKPVEVFDLQLFAEGGAGDSGTSAATGITGQSEAQTSGASTIPGENTNAADSGEGEVPSRAEQYKKFRSDYKQEFDAEIQKAIR
jgi:hypothetical protein